MSYLWKIVRTIMAIFGVFLMYSGASASDYYVLELGQAEPSSVWTTIFIGFLLIVPAFIHGCYQSMKGEDE